MENGPPGFILTIVNRDPKEVGRIVHTPSHKNPGTVNNTIVSFSMKLGVSGNVILENEAASDVSIYYSICIQSDQSDKTTKKNSH